MPMDQSGIQRNDASADARDSHRLDIQEGYPSYGVSNDAEIPNLYRLLDLVDERGPGGIVEKIVIDQNSLRRLLNTVHPGSYESISKINFKALDDLSIKPIGVYGVRPEIIKFLQEAHYIDETCAALLSRTHSPDDSSPTLRSGLYLALDPDHQDRGTSKAVYIIYWPEDTTWDDQAALPSVQRNRTIFMRYLYKLTDQIIALVSSTQAKAFVWDTSVHNQEPRGDQPENDEDFRLFDFEVAKSCEQEEDAVGTPGFTAIVEPSLLPQASEGAASQARLVSGEEKIALLVIRSEEEQYKDEKQFESSVTSINLREMIESKDCPIQLGNLAPAHLQILAQHGLRDQHPIIFSRYEERLEELKIEQSRSEESDNKAIEDQINCDTPKIRQVVQNSVRIRYNKLYPGLNLRLDTSHEPDVTEELYSLYPSLTKIDNEIDKNKLLETVQDGEFQLLKGKWPLIKGCLEENPMQSDVEHQSSIDDILNQSTTVSPQISDLEFVFQLRRMEKGYPALSGLAQKVHNGLRRDLEDRIVVQLLDTIVTLKRKSEKATASRARDQKHQEETNRAFEVVMQGLREAMTSKARQVRRIDWIRTTVRRFHRTIGSAASMRWGGSVASLRPAQKRYSIYPLELTEQDSHTCRVDEAHVPQPRLNMRHKFEFALPEGRAVEFMQLIRNKCLVVVAERGRTQIFIEDNVTIDHAVNLTHSKVSLSHESLGGPQCKFAFDQATRLLAVVHGHKDDLKLSIFISDELFTNLQSKGSPISLRSWYGNRPIDLSQIYFVSGLEQICFMEVSGRARIFSLTTQQFLNASLQIDQPIVDAFSSPDGSCLLVVVPMDEPTSHRLLAFHWDSFGNNKKGIESARLCPCDGYRVATRFEGRGRVHVVSFNAASSLIASTVLQITRNATEFTFRKRITETKNNSLIDCHLEVWTQFPMVSEIIRTTPVAINRQPQSLTFASTVGLQKIEDYFARMISIFDMGTWKPISGILTALELKPTNKTGRNIVREISEFTLGSFIVELLCLIPLQLAVTRENRFIPLKDGVWDPEYERSLLGADVVAIVDALSLGWYESLLQSYMATKVSLSIQILTRFWPLMCIKQARYGGQFMSDQSADDYYYLNHFVNTSFAGSAMCATEGVWLSCIPTEKCLLVLLGFEGGHSIERTPQEKVLLALFGTAISNLVLFRNNFVGPTNIADLFTVWNVGMIAHRSELNAPYAQSFQSSVTLLDPNVNRGLFNSTLAIIIKDVTNADSNDIVKEFSLKLKGIVDKEKDQNFITRLHRGRVQIIPWPIIKSHKFYTLFRSLYQALNQQPFTHDSGGDFLHNLKILMAKLRSQDWGSMDHNIVAHRVKRLMARLPMALSLGQYDDGPPKARPSHNMGMDGGRDISNLLPMLFVPEFATENAAESEALAEQALSELVRACEKPLHNRHQISDSSYVETLQKSIYETLDQRLSLVQKWVTVNIERFPSGNQDIRNLTTKLHSASLGMRNAVRLCSSGCSSCQLLCLRAYRHSGEHSCGTSHECIFDCEVADEHSKREACGLPAGHGGRHMCDVKAHSCGLECHLSDKGGCAQSCIKPLDHEGEHICSARAHICGAPCDLIVVNHGNSGGVYNCPGTCVALWDESHDRHACKNASVCPIECALCPRQCYSSDHFHGLIPSAIHLCGREHSCARFCEADGLCQIETRPSVIQEFSGRDDLFKSARFIQVNRRLSCAVLIPPGKLSHQGIHTHDTAEDAFHYCDVRCPSCEYFCRLPYGHGQHLHETGHGSMLTNRWALQTDQDDKDPAYESQGPTAGLGNEGAPMLCNLVCAAQGRHAHIDFCRDPGNCSNMDCKHIERRMIPDPDREKDLISHATFWARSGFKDPYSHEERNEFSKCDAYCTGPEHKATTTSPADCKTPGIECI